MTSTYVNYRLYAADMAKSLTREAALKTNARETEYYKANIGGITSIDDLLKNTRLYNYAMRAYGLDDMVYAKAFMRKVLESDLTDANSFVRRLADTRFLTFAEAFNFKPNGTIAPSSVVAQDTSSQDKTIGLYSDRRIKQGATLATEIDYFRGKMQTITSVDDLISNQRLFDFTVKTFGFDPKIVSASHIRSVLTSDLSDPQSVANQMTNTNYRLMAEAFSFETDGSVASGSTAQTGDQTTAMIFRAYEKNGLTASPAAAAFRTTYYDAQMALVTTVDDLVNNRNLFEYVATAFGFDPVVESTVRMREVLTSDLSDPQSPANTLASGYKRMAQAFNFNTDGTLDSGTPPQTTDQRTTLVDGFMENYENKAERSDGIDETIYRVSISGITSVDQILSTPKIYSYVLGAFGIDPTTVTKTAIRRVLTSDLTDPTSFANSSRNAAFKELAAAFNFDESGNAQTARLAQTQSAMRTTMLSYIAAVGDPNIEKAETKTENDYYRDTIPTIASLDELLDNDRLVTYMVTAYGLDPNVVDTGVLRQILTSDLEDRTSFANAASNTQYRTLASAFNFDAEGMIVREAMNTPQDRQDRLTTSDLYLRQSIELRAGEDNDGVRLALYFKRIASSIDTPYEILADKAIFEVVRTALSLPATMSLAELDTQAAMITKKLTIADFKDPAKLEKFIARFSALYDIQNSENTQQSLIATLFNN